MITLLKYTVLFSAFVQKMAQTVQPSTEKETPGPPVLRMSFSDALEN